MRYFPYFILLFYSFTSQAWADSAVPPKPTTEISLIVEVQHIEVEGGFYGLVTEEGQKYRPQALPELYQQAGLWIQVRAKRINQLGFRMWGQTISITHICTIPCIQFSSEIHLPNGT
jgi:hypothetical protein